MRNWLIAKAALPLVLLYVILPAARAQIDFPDQIDFIDFEDLSAGAVVLNQYASRGVVFPNHRSSTRPVAIDYSSEIPGVFAHSGSKALEQRCAGEICIAVPFEMTFTQTPAPQRVKLWVGYSARLTETRTVVLTAFGTSGSLRVTTTLFPTTGPQPIRIPLEVVSPRADITRVTVEFSSTPDTGSLAIDDLEFGAAIRPTIVTSSLAGGTVGAAYSQKLEADLGVPPYSNWRVSSGSLPPGLVLDNASGVISGTPISGAGSSFGFSVTVDDSVGVRSNPKSLSITITAVPAISSLSPNSRPAGTTGFPLIVNGSGFAPGAVVQWNGQPLPTTFASPTQLTATVGSERIATAGTANITVVSQGLTSAPPVPFTITPRPRITSLSPSSRTAGSPGFPLIVNGVGFAPGAVVQWSGQPLPTTFFNPGQISADVTAERLANAGIVNITVISQEVLTAPVSFAILGGPMITTDSALSATAGSAYSQRLLATGGSGTYPDWVILNGSLPAGLNLGRATGMISGTPAAEGFSTFTVQVTDSGGSKGTKLFSLQVLAGGPPSVSIAPENIFLEIAGGALAGERNISVRLRGAGTLAVMAAAEAGTPWLSVTPSTGTATAATPLSLAVRVNAAGLAAGTHFGRITVTAGDTVSVIPVTVVIRPSPRPTLQLSQGGLQFKAASGVRTVPAQQFAIINSGQGLLMWTASAEAFSGGPSWLSVSPPAGSSDASNSSAPMAEVRVNPASLTPGNYYGQIRVAAPDATNRVQILTVALSVLPPEQRVEPVVLPTGLIFIAPVGGTPPAAQDVIVSNVGRNEITFTTEASSSDGQVWFTHTPATSVVPAEGSVRVTVGPAAAPLQPGIRRGSLVFTFNDGAKRSVDLLLVVVSTSSAANALAGPAANGGCQANQLIPVFTTLSSLAGFPVALRSSQTVRVRAVEVGPNCAQFVTSGSMWLDVTDGSSTPGQHESEGVWAANWTPLTAGPITVKSTVTNAAGLSGQAEVTAQAAQDPASVLPVTQSITNGASYVLGQPVAPGSWVAIKGAELAVVDRDVANQIPYPMDLSGTSVELGERALPMYYVDRQQINALVPFDALVDTSLPLRIRRQRVPSEVLQVMVAQPQPGIFTADSSGSGQGSILISGTPMLAAPASAGSRPAVRGEFISIYGAGMGAVDNPPGPGAPGPVDPLARVIGPAPVQVEIGGRPANVTFAGLAPGLIGVYQVDAQVPQDSPTGDNVPVVIIQGSARTPPGVTMAVE